MTNIQEQDYSLWKCYITKTALAKRVARIKKKFRKNYRESEKKFVEDRAQTASAGHDKVKGGNKQ